MSTLPPPPLTFHSNFTPKFQSLPPPSSPYLHHLPFTSYFTTPHLPPKLQSLPSFTPHSLRPGCEGSVTEEDITQTPQKRSIFLTDDEVEKVEYIENFTYECKLPSGYLTIRAMRENEVDMAAGLLSESFAESMLLPSVYLTVLGFLIRQYLAEKRGLFPHAVTLLGFYTCDSGGCVDNGGGCVDNGGGGGGGCGDNGGGGRGVFAGTVEVSFNKRGASASPPSPTPPKDCPYICNMTVHKSLRRKGIGWHLLKASEELISTMTSTRKVYLHCRMIDSAPLNMYRKASYNIVKTDNLFVLFMLQRRKHLMCKEIETFEGENEAD